MFTLLARSLVDTSRKAATAPAIIGRGSCLDPWLSFSYQGIINVMMRTRLNKTMSGLTVGALVLGCTLATTGNADVTTISNCKQDYELCLDAWKDERLAFLKSDIGYLNLAGLYWLKEGTNSFGGGAGNDIVFPGKAESSIGTFTLSDGEVRLAVKPEVDVRHMDRPVNHLLMAGESVKDGIVATHGDLAWTVINRDNRFAVRLRDFDSPVVKNFPPIEYYPVSATNRVSAKLHLYEKPRTIRVETVIEGLNYNPWSPGVVKFEIDGETFELEAYDAGGELFFVFGDQTSGRGSYPAGRFLYAKKPDANGVTELDFNTAHSPPCAYNEFATCPIASARNRIATRITAGERYDPAHH
ncbi:MAG: hypothetical protein DRR15_15915 [Gammaproteobacteria bacterium]|nr:MAG: hypothetical protein DRR15_15915 [Gammaproteobacteria bacterium]